MQDSRFGLKQTRAIIGNQPKPGKNARERFGGMHGAGGWSAQPAVSRFQGHEAVAFGRKPRKPALEELENGRKMTLGGNFFRGASPYETTGYAPPELRNRRQALDKVHQFLLN